MCINKMKGWSKSYRNMILPMLLHLLPAATFSQNTFPTTGNAGIGTSSPVRPLQVVVPTGDSHKEIISVSGIDYLYNQNRLWGAVPIPPTIGIDNNYGLTWFNDGYLVGTSIVANQQIITTASNDANRKTFRISAVDNNLGNFSLELTNNGPNLANPNNIWNQKPNNSNVFAWNKPLNIGSLGSVLRLFADAGNANKVADIFVGGALVGIGTETPRDKLNVYDGNLQISSAAGLNSSVGEIRFSNHNSPGAYAGIGGRINASGTDQLDLLFFTAFGGASEKMRILANSGNVGIGTSNPQAKLDVAGNIFSSGKVGIGTTNVTDNNYKLFVETGIRTRKVKVDLATWPDYVFETSYQLPSLSHIEQYIKQYKHLPQVPAAAEIENNGLDIGEMQALQMKKIEELTLYIIELEKTNKKLETAFQKMELQLQQLDRIVNKKN